MTLHPAKVTLIDQTGEVSPDDLAQYASAFNDDIMARFGPTWGARAVVTVEKEKPTHGWAIYIQAKLSEPGALGFHTDQLNQPVSYVELTDGLSTTISHELKEMLADQFGNRLRSAELPLMLDPSAVDLLIGDHVRYLLEVCDPCEESSYQVDGVSVSDHLLPTWYEPESTQTGSFTGFCRPLEVANGGYCSFARDDDEWFQVFNENGSMQVQDIGKFDRARFGSLREFTDFHSRERRTKS